MAIRVDAAVHSQLGCRAISSVSNVRVALTQRSDVVCLRIFFHGYEWLGYVFTIELDASSISFIRLEGYYWSSLPCL